MNSPADKFLASVKARAAAATPGPWSKTSALPMYAIAADKVDVVTATGREYRANHSGRHGCREADAEFIAHARTDIERLVAMVEAARKALDDVTWHARPDCLPALAIAEKCLAALDRLAAGEVGE